MGMERRLHWLRHSQEQRVGSEIAHLKPPKRQAGQMLQREQACFAKQAQRMNYQQIARRGWPIGSGGRSNRPVGKNNAASNGQDNFGPDPDCATCWLWMRLVATTTGTNFGIKNNAWMRPGSTDSKTWPVLPA